MAQEDQARLVQPFVKLNRTAAGSTAQPFERYDAVDGDLAAARLRAMGRHPSRQEAPESPQEARPASEDPDDLARPAERHLALVQADADDLAFALES